MPVFATPERRTFEVGGTRFTSLATPSSGSAETATWYVRVAPRTAGTPHRITREEILVALAGSARATVNGERIELHEGSTLVVPAASDLSLENPYDLEFELLAIYPVGGEVIVGDAAPFTPPWAK